MKESISAFICPNLFSFEKLGKYKYKAKRALIVLASQSKFVGILRIYLKGVEILLFLKIFKNKNKNIKLLKDSFF